MNQYEFMNDEGNCETCPPGTKQDYASNTCIPDCKGDYGNNNLKIGFLTPRLSGFEIRNDETLIFQNYEFLVCNGYIAT